MESETLMHRILEKLETLEKGQQDSKTAMHDFKQEMNGLKLEMANVKQELNGFELHVTDLKQEVNGLKVEMTDVKQEVTVLRVEMTDVKQEVNGLKVEITDFKQETKTGFKQLNQKLDLLTKQTSNAVVENHSNELKFLASKVQELEKDIYKLKQS
ncbi:hypothetical protein GCM10009001_24720 [Virgibacillus siamensis]|uniref:Uncharacterized protein n=1 Tax=Virgibacillus siamensis TaxID=480071 RepID=A0ABP3RBD9_9BACI